MSEARAKMSEPALPAAGPELQWQVEQFYYHEAELLDDRRFDEWYELLADDLSYRMPVRANVYPADVKNRSPESAGYGGDFFDDGKYRMGLRVKKLLSGRDHIERPASMLRHLVTNVRIREVDAPGEIAVRSCFFVHRLRHGEFQDLYTGERHDRLRRVDTVAGWQIVERVIVLDQSTLLGGGIGFLF